MPLARTNDAQDVSAPSYRTWLTAASIAACSLTAGSIFCFPLFSPSLTRDLDLTLKQTSSIWVGAVLGEYGFAAPAGILADRFGPRVLCIVAAALFFLGYNMMGREEAVAVAARVLRESRISDLADSVVGTAAPIAPRHASYLRLAFAFFLCGAGVSASYFSAVTAATRTFPNFPSLAIALPLTLFSLSSMLLSAIGSSFFADPLTGDLNTSAYLYFLAYMLGIVNLCAAVGMHNYKPISPSPTPERRRSVADGSDGSDTESEDDYHGLDESTALISSEIRPSRSSLPYLPEDSSLSSFLSAPSVWAIAFIMFIAVGSCEMLMSCVGSVVESLLGAEPEVHGQGGMTALLALGGTLTPKMTKVVAAAPNKEWARAALEIRGTQIRLLSTMNTVSRLGSGLLADLCAPTSMRVQQARAQGRYTFVLSRLAVILFALCLLFVAFLYAALGFPPASEGPTPIPAPSSTFIRLSMVSISTGLAYGLVFTLAPSILASAFDVSKFGRNWGLLSYACAIGSLAYTMLYASISDWVAQSAAQAQQLLAQYASGLGVELVHVAQKGAGQCLSGPKCFQLTFGIAAASILLAIATAIPLWRAWRHAL
ncbi:unnamed protein product [Tilletia laevis]|uniref:Nodulin-like domain-containing protein n=2 Tax=Tilletia TaxID=13289 RepID=A0A177VAP4_9BASI|nr:hypothetical protein CF336_g1198 [Tilletia laevis]KAE8264605.1 hypothetical protein A4X03_0g827 [Tilletia caries]CAD6904586.1 unnamed protein product [Tilletia controversa]KAE8207465.1 hypothetical protein CF335_g1117 [Tilletia laevis]CAD6891151.1 unnamed protein product [Tilletia caries]